MGVLVWSAVGVKGGVCVKGMGDTSSAFAAAVVYAVELIIRVAGVAGIRVTVCIDVSVQEGLLRQQ